MRLHLSLHSRLPFVLLFILCTGILTACLSAPTTNGKSAISNIRVVMDNNYPPYAFTNEQGELQGILVDEWRLWEKRTGVKVEIVGLPWDEALSGMKNGKFDVVDTIFYTDERAQIFDFTKPYANIDVRIFFPSNVSGIANVESLQGFRVAVKSGDANAEYLIAHGVTDLVYYDNYEDIIQAAAKRKTSIFVVDQPPALYFLYKYGIQNQFNYSPPLYGGEFHRAVKKGNTAMLDLVNQGFDKISAVEYQHINDRWLGANQSAAVTRLIPYIGIVAAAALFLIATLALFNRELQSRVKDRTEELRKSAERYRAVIENQTEFIVRWAPDGTLTFVNDAYCRYFNVTPQQATAVNFTTRVAEEDRLAVEEKIARLKSGLANVETDIHRVITPDGSTGWQEWTDQAIRDEFGHLVEIQSVGRDITERQRNNAKILRLNRLYLTISQINQTIIYKRDKESLFKEICRVAIAYGQFRMAWIGLIRESDHQIVPVVFAGEEQGYLKNIQIKYQDEKLGCGPTGIAVREERCVIAQDISADPNMLTWREAALERGYRSSAAVPIHERGCVVGALTVYASEPQFFDEDNKNLLDEIGMDISFALDSINTETERGHAEAALLQESALNAKMANDLQVTYDKTLEGWSHAMDLRDKETEGHTRRVSELVVKLAHVMGLGNEETLHIKRGGLLHDIGKMGIPDSILLKPHKLTKEEWSIMHKHPIYAYEMLSQIEYLRPALDIPYSHHEHWDGKGYPKGLKGEEIPLAARMFAVVDVWDALTSDRPYRTAWTKEKVKEYLRKGMGKQFDPLIVKTFLQMIDNEE